MSSPSGIKTAKNYPLHTQPSDGENFKALYECPINEDNIESVLDESIAATAAMRTQLAALKDDLKRLGGGSNMSDHLKPVHLQRRMEVATHLADAFVKYQQTIDTIGEFNQLPDLDFSQGAWSMSEVGGSQRGGTAGRGGKGSRGPYGKRGGGRGISASVPHTSEKLRDIKLPGHITPKKTAMSQSTSASGDRPKQAPTVARTIPIPTAAQVANDLWMSCEPGSDDEEIYGATGKRKKR